MLYITYLACWGMRLACWGMRPGVLGANVHEQRNLRIQGRMQIFEKMSQKASNRILALPNYSTAPGAFDFFRNYKFTKQQRLQTIQTLKN